MMCLKCKGKGWVYRTIRRHGKKIQVTAVCKGPNCRQGVLITDS